MTDHEGIAHGLTEREYEIYRLSVVNQLSQRVIAEKYGLSQERIGQILRGVRDKLPPVDLEAVRQKALALHEDVIRRAYELAEMNGAPVTAGKDGSVVYDPESGAVVRDYAGKLNALQLALKADEARRKLLGADAATKTEVTGSVRYEVVGIDPSDLT
jgi:predicted DNA-binding protein (UPF0251 family)